MKSSIYDTQTLRRLFQSQPVATLPEMMRALGTPVAVTVFRKLKALHYLTSYSHRGRYYTLREVARFNEQGLWSWELVWFSNHGTLLNTAKTLVDSSGEGYWAEELADVLHVEVHDALRHLVHQGQLSRQTMLGRYLYTSADAEVQRRQVLQRRSTQTFPLPVEVRTLDIPADELRAAILLFYGLLDEQQRRLYAGLESLKLGRGGDGRLAELLGLDVHTVARGRQQLLDREVRYEGVRQAGGGRKTVKKNS